MKKKLILLFVCLLMLSLGFKKTNNYSLPLLGKLIVIDPGHGGKDPGTMYKNIYEKNLVLNISLYLEKKLNEKGASTISTRSGDYDLSKPNALYRKKSDFDNRIKLINNPNADLYISIHQNIYQNKKYSGPQVFYVKDNQKLAEIIQNTLNKYLNTKRKVKTINNTYMYKLLKKKGILIECGFISNDNERYKLKTEEYQLKLSKIITEGIITYYS